MPKGPMEREVDYLWASEDLRRALKTAFKLALTTADEIVKEAAKEDLIDSSEVQKYKVQAVNYYMWELMHHLFLVGRKARNIKEADDIAFEKG
jgi:hypothetical protein